MVNGWVTGTIFIFIKTHTSRLLTLFLFFKCFLSHLFSSTRSRITRKNCDTYTIYGRVMFYYLTHAHKVTIVCSLPCVQSSDTCKYETNMLLLKVYLIVLIVLLFIFSFLNVLPSRAQRCCLSSAMI